MKNYEKEEYDLNYFTEKRSQRLRASLRKKIRR